MSEVAALLAIGPARRHPRHSPGEQLADFQQKPTTPS
jgi:hypothetical protein